MLSTGSERTEDSHLQTSKSISKRSRRGKSHKLKLKFSRKNKKQIMLKSSHLKLKSSRTRAVSVNEKQVRPSSKNSKKLAES